MVCCIIAKQTSHCLNVIFTKPIPPPTPPQIALPLLDYGSGPVYITDFYADVVSLPGFSTASGGAAYTLTNPSWRWIGSTGYDASCVPTSTVSYGGLVGAGPGGMQGLAAGATCSSPQGGKAPCVTEVPPMIQALLSANNLPPMYTIDLPPPSPTSRVFAFVCGVTLTGGGVGELSVQRV
jgi:hypothetical protein